jgi:hypothetical protein
MPDLPTGREPLWIPGAHAPHLDYDAWIGLLRRLAERDKVARTVDCTRCGARWTEACMAPTGLAASESCPVRVADAQAAATGAAA